MDSKAENADDAPETSTADTEMLDGPSMLMRTIAVMIFPLGMCGAFESTWLLQNWYCKYSLSRPDDKKKISRGFAAAKEIKQAGKKCLFKFRTS
jgi:hypothetical protein